MDINKVDLLLKYILAAGQKEYGEGSGAKRPWVHAR